MGEQPAQAKSKIDQILEWIEKSDYFQIFNLPRNANSVQIRDAYFKLTQQYHPDKYYSTVDKAARDKITIVFKRMNEAYMVLKDSQKRARYEKAISGPEREKNLRFSLADETDRGPANPEDQAQTPNGKKYLKLALAAQKSKQWRIVEQNIKFALGFEPNNDSMKKMMEQAKVEIAKLPKEDPFKIR